MSGRHRKKFVLRKIRGGRVRIYGHDYAPREPLRPEHEGQKALFATYRGYKGDEEFQPFVALWGSEREYREREREEFDPTWLSDPDAQGRRFFVWQWWDRVSSAPELVPSHGDSHSAAFRGGPQNPVRGRLPKEKQ